MLGGVLLFALVVVAAVAALLTVPASRIASLVRTTVPVTMVAAGGLLVLAGRGGLGVPLAAMGLAWLARNRSTTTASSQGGRRSSVRSALFEMELDHDSGEMDGVVLTGPMEGRRLSGMNENSLLELLRQSAQDGESRELLEAYLDRRMPGWRDHAKADAGPGQAGAAGAGPMSQQEAYQILGLEPGATAQEIRDAHRRLMKRVHPDSGGSTFLASRINEAKDTLLG